MLKKHKIIEEKFLYNHLKGNKLNNLNLDTKK